MSKKPWEIPIRYNESHDSGSPIDEGEEETVLVRKFQEMDRSASKPDPRLADNTPMVYRNGDADAVIDVDDGDENR